MKRFLMAITFAAFFIPGICFSAGCEAVIERASWDGVEVYRISVGHVSEYRSSLYTALSAASRLRADCASMASIADETARELVFELIKKGIIRPEWEPVAR